MPSRIEMETPCIGCAEASHLLDGNKAALRGQPSAELTSVLQRLHKLEVDNADLHQTVSQLQSQMQQLQLRRGGPGHDASQSKGLPPLPRLNTAARSTAGVPGKKPPRNQ